MKTRTWTTAALAAAAVLTVSWPALAAGLIQSQEVLAKVRPGTTDTKELQALLGAPLRKYTVRATGYEAWEWEALESSKRVTISITIANGVVRDVQRIRMDGGV